MTAQNYEMITELTFKKFLVKKIQCNILIQVIKNAFPWRYYATGADGIGELGRGAGRGGGAGGKVREAGGALGVRGAVKEEEYFHKLQREQIEDLKLKLEEENAENTKRIKELLGKVKNNSEMIQNMKKCYKNFKNDIEEGDSSKK